MGVCRTLHVHHSMDSSPATSSLLPWRLGGLNCICALCTRRESVTCVITETIWDRRSLHRPFLRKDQTPVRSSDDARHHLVDDSILLMLMLTYPGVT